MQTHERTNLESPALGVGYYTLGEAARILRIPTRRLSRWANGYRGQARQISYTGRPVIARSLTDDGATVLTFQDLIELLFVKLFRQKGVTMQTIHAAAVEARRIFQTDHPFAVQRFDTDGKRIFATLLLSPEKIAGITAQKALEDLASSQMVMDEIARPYFRKIDYDHDGATRYWPMGRERNVVIDAHRAFGQPIVNSSGVPTRPLYEMAKAGETVESTARWYEVPEEDVRTAIEYEDQAMAA